MKPILELKNVYYSYQKGKNKRNILNDVSACFECGKVYSIVGKSGNGKTTLLSLMAGLDLPDMGDVIFKGQKTSAMDLNEYRRSKVSIIYQDFALFPLLTARENVMYPLLLSSTNKEEALKEANLLLDKVGIREETKNHYPSKISGGEQQRVAIARALAKKPKLLLCDEPTGALDSKTGQMVLEVLQKTCKEYGMTVVIITHNSVIAQIANRVIKMKNGTVEEITINEHPLDIKEINW